jgi:hypothetical protein
VITDEMVGDLLTRTFTVVVDDVPELPPLAWSDARARQVVQNPSRKRALMARARRHKGWTFSIAVAVGVAGAGAGAAATGRFSAPANDTFRQYYKMPLPAAFGQIPAFNSAKEKLEVVDPGPENTTISVWIYPESASLLCVAGVESEPGKATFPGKPARQVPVGGCSGSPLGDEGPATPGPTQNRTYGTFGGIWRGPSGRLYWIVASSAPIGASRVEMKLSDGLVRSAPVMNGWYAIALPDSQAVGYSGTFYGPSGQVVPGQAEG